VAPPLPHEELLLAPLRLLLLLPLPLRPPRSLLLLMVLLLLLLLQLLLPLSSLWLLHSPGVRRSRSPDLDRELPTPNACCLSAASASAAGASGAAGGMPPSHPPAAARMAIGARSKAPPVPAPNWAVQSAVTAGETRADPAECPMPRPWTSGRWARRGPGSEADGSLAAVATDCCNKRVRPIPAADFSCDAGSAGEPTPCPGAGPNSAGRW